MKDELEDMVAMMEGLKKECGATDRENQLIAALRHWVFMYRWKVDGMNIEQARIHADVFVDQGVRSLPPPKAADSGLLEAPTREDVARAIAGAIAERHRHSLEDWLNDSRREEADAVLALLTKAGKQGDTGNG